MNLKSTSRAMRGAHPIVWRLVALVVGLNLLPLASASASNGFIVEPYIIECDTGAGCASVSVPWLVIQDRCRDSDGCTMRTTLLASGSGLRATGAAYSFAVDSVGYGWSLSSGFATNVADFGVGTNGDSAVEEVQLLKFGSSGECSFRDDTVELPTQLSFELNATADVSGAVVCTVRIDD